MSYPLLGIDPTLVNDVDPTHTPGRIYSAHDGCLYRYGQFKDAVTYVAGHVCTIAAVDMTAFTNDISGGSSIGSIVAGVAVRVMTQNYYGFVKCAGYHATIVTSGADDIAIGESLIVHGSTDGACDGVAAGSTTTASFGVCVTADIDAANTVAGIIRGLI